MSLHRRDGTEIVQGDEIRSSPGESSRMPTGTIGILGGLGPLAGAHFYKRLVEKTPAENDSEHLPVIVLSDPRLPSRVEHLFGGGPNPGPALAGLAKLLEQMGASIIAVPSSTSHAYYDEFSALGSAKVINLLDEVGNAVHRAGCRAPAILATTATAKLNLYRPYLESFSVPLYPDDRVQEQLQQLISGIKGGEGATELPERIIDIVKGEWASGADCAVLACTDLCVFPIDELHKMGLELPVISATDVLVDAVLQSVGEFQEGA